MSGAVFTLALCWLSVLPDARAQAENYDLFRCDMAVSGVFAHGTTSWGVGGLVEPKFNILDSLAVGMRFDGAGMFGASYGIDDVGFSMWGSAGILAKVDYYFLDAPFRPWVGLGLGMYYIGAQSIDAGDQNANISQQAGAYFGLGPQVGIEMGGFRLSVTYNAIIGATVEVTQNVGTGSEAKSDLLRNFLTVELGWRIGGGYHDPSEKKAAEEGATEQPKE